MGCRGRLHIFPFDFTLPAGPSSIAWQYWLCGDRSRGYPPLRLLRPVDLPSARIRKRRSEYAFLMGALETRARQLPIWKETPTVIEANRIFEESKKDVLVLDEQSDKKRKRRPEQVSWTTMVNLVRTRKRPRMDQ